MKPKAAVKMTIDVAMTLALLFLMGYQFWGELAHEWVGAGMFALFILHHILNRSWYKVLGKGRYMPVRVLQTVIDFAVLAAMLALMYSGLVLSRHVFAFLPLEGGMSLARRLHILGSSWGFVLMSVHLGLHWNMILGMARRAKKHKTSKPGRVLLFALAALIAAYGLLVFFRRDIAGSLLLRSEFVFLDYEEPVPLFYLDYLAMMGLWIFLAHYAGALLQKCGARR